MTLTNSNKIRLPQHVTFQSNNYLMFVASNRSNISNGVWTERWVVKENYSTVAEGTMITSKTKMQNKLELSKWVRLLWPCMGIKKEKFKYKIGLSMCRWVNLNSGIIFWIESLPKRIHTFFHLQARLIKMSLLITLKNATYTIGYSQRNTFTITRKMKI